LAAFASGANAGKAVTDAPKIAKIARAERDLIIFGAADCACRRSHCDRGSDYNDAEGPKFLKRRAELRTYRLQCKNER
jgi:hypothetical protein